MGTIAGILSSYSPYFFMSGVKEIGESGWWKLTFSKLYPGFIVALSKLTFKYLLMIFYV